MMQEIHQGQKRHYSTIGPCDALRPCIRFEFMCVNVSMTAHLSTVITRTTISLRVLFGMCPFIPFAVIRFNLCQTFSVCPAFHSSPALSHDSQQRSSLEQVIHRMLAATVATSSRLLGIMHWPS